MTTLAAGKLRHRVTLQRDTGTTTSSVGQHVVAYTTIGTYYALVEPLAADEVVNANQMKGIRKYKVTMRNIAFNPTDVLTWNGITLNIKGTTLDPFGIYVTIDAIELIANQ